MGIAEDLVLLTVNPRSGRFTMPNRFIYALRSAQLADLIMAGLITLNDGQIKIVKKAERPLTFDERVTVGEIESLREQTVDQWMHKISQSLGMDHVKSLNRQGAVKLNTDRYKYNFLWAQRATAVDHVRYRHVLS